MHQDSFIKTPWCDQSSLSSANSFLGLDREKSRFVYRRALSGEIGDNLHIERSFLLSLIWRAVKPLVDPVTLAKVKVVDSKNKKDPYAIRNSLMESIPIDNIPREYGGHSDVPLGFAPEEEYLKELMQQNNQPPGQQYQQQLQETGQYYNHDNDTNNN